MNEPLHPIGEVARRFGLRVSALRYYDELGLVPPAERRGTVRYYGREELRRLALVQRLHREGMVTLADTAVLTTDRHGEEQPAGRQVLADTIAGMTRRIDELVAARAVLEHLLTCPTADPVRQCSKLRADLDEIVDRVM
ncbi:DNA-binding transcriptional MerR regulator [Kutzneria viridogrisea]|uniref:DNA-binding transcriptional MerR regulator n=1 Tax=Kutzneria viridogrisea TaxID=47990 RepID=A0ABR6BFB2_9PSEU|nr:MerR family transcriptional regulator [Kutzneria albida]MBA8925568.1 DNA-binding transcriptional MerR regulator [Kutzneria viridogrisea]